MTYRSMLDQIKQQGYNTLRLPYSNQLFDPGSVPNGIDFSNGKNADLQGLNGVQIMDKSSSVRGTNRSARDFGPAPSRQRGTIRIVVYGCVFRTTLAGRFGRCWHSGMPDMATVVGADLHNEPHGAACWGCGDIAADSGLPQNAAAMRFIP